MGEQERAADLRGREGIMRGFREEAHGGSSRGGPEGEEELSLISSHYLFGLESSTSRVIVKFVCCSTRRLWGGIDSRRSVPGVGRPGRAAQ